MRRFGSKRVRGAQPTPALLDNGQGSGGNEGLRMDLLYMDGKLKSINWGWLTLGGGTHVGEKFERGGTSIRQGDGLWEKGYKVGE